ncbi:hypothetical protein POSPLADRAFT_1107074, partial [Postia placenta MAD-698-R-SB12]
MLRTDQLRTDQRAQPALISPCHLRFEPSSPSLRLGGAHPYYTLRYVDKPRAPPLPPPITVADEFFDCSRLEHAFDTQEQVDVSRGDPDRNGNLAPFFSCDRQPCPNRTPRSITTNKDEGRYVPIRRVQHPSGPALRYAGTSRSTSRHVTPVPSRPASPGTRIPQPVASTGQARGD